MFNSAAWQLVPVAPESRQGLKRKPAVSAAPHGPSALHRAQPRRRAITAPQPAQPHNHRSPLLGPQAAARRPAGSPKTSPRSREERCHHGKAASRVGHTEAASAPAPRLAQHRRDGDGRGSEIGRHRVEVSFAADLSPQWAPPSEADLCRPSRQRTRAARHAAPLRPSLGRVRAAPTGAVRPWIRRRHSWLRSPGAGQTPHALRTGTLSGRLHASSLYLSRATDAGLSHKERDHPQRAASRPHLKDRLAVSHVTFNILLSWSAGPI